MSRPKLFGRKLSHSGEYSASYIVPGYPLTSCVRSLLANSVRMYADILPAITPGMLPVAILDAA